MNITSLLAIYFIVWWMTLLVVLPFGVRSQVESGEFVTGTDPGAPKHTHMMKKLLITTFLSAIIFICLYLYLTSDYFNFE